MQYVNTCNLNTIKHSKVTGMASLRQASHSPHRHGHCRRRSRRSRRFHWETPRTWNASPHRRFLKRIAQQTVGDFMAKLYRDAAGDVSPCSEVNDGFKPLVSECFKQSFQPARMILHINPFLSEKPSFISNLSDPALSPDVAVILEKANLAADSISRNFPSTFMKNLLQNGNQLVLSCFWPGMKWMHTQETRLPQKTWHGCLISGFLFPQCVPQAFVAFFNLLERFHAAIPASGFWATPTRGQTAPEPIKWTWHHYIQQAQWYGLRMPMYCNHLWNSAETWWVAW